MRFLPGAFLAMLLGLAPDDRPDLAALVQQLGSDVEAEREQAAGTLERLGAEAVPVLRVALDSRNPRVRERAAGVLERIEGNRLFQPTEVRLDFDDQPLPRVVEAINRQAGTALVLFPELDPALTQRTITLHEPGPVPFWRALDRLCEAGRVHLSLAFAQSSTSRVPAFRLVDGAPGPSFIFYHGPIRLKLINIERDRVRNLDRAAGMPEPAAGRFFARLEVFAEPRLLLGTDQMPWLTEATDDLGQSLVSQERSGRGLPFGPGGANRTTLPLPMEDPERPGRTIDRMAGIVPVTLAVREATPLLIRLDEAVGKTFRHAGVRLDVLGIHPDPAGRSPHVLDILLRPDESADAGRRGPAGRLPLLSAGGDWDIDQSQIELLDAQDRRIPWLPSTQRLPEGLRGSLRTHLPKGAEDARPVKLRFYGLIRRRVEVPFRFESVPMP